MACLFLESWEAYGGDSTSANVNWGGGTITLSPVNKHTGSYAFGSGSGQANGRLISPGSTTLFCGGYVWWTGARPAQDGTIFGWTSGGLYTGFNDIAGVRANADGSVSVENGFNFATVVGTSAAGVLVTNSWNRIECKFIFGGSGTSTAIIKINGTTVLTVTTASFGSAAPASIHIGNAANYALDDLWVFDSTGTTCNDFPASSNGVAVQYLPAVAGNGSNTGLTPSTGTDHGANIDDAIPNGDTDYNSGGAGLIDTYNVVTTGLSGLTIYAAQMGMYARGDTAGTNSIAGVFRSAGTDYICSTINLTTTYSYVYGQSGQTAGAPSTLTETGAKVIAAAGSVRVSQAFAEMLVDSVTSVQVSQAVVETLTFGTPPLRVSQQVVETLTLGAPAMRVSQLVVETLTHSPALGIQVSHVVMETLVTNVNGGAKSYCWIGDGMGAIFID